MASEKDLRNRARLYEQVFNAFQLEAHALAMSKEKGGKGFPPRVVVFQSLHFGIRLVRESYGDAKVLELLRGVTKSIERGQENLWENFEFASEDGQ